MPTYFFQCLEIIMSLEILHLYQPSEHKTFACIQRRPNAFDVGPTAGVRNKGV